MELLLTTMNSLVTFTHRLIQVISGKLGDNWVKFFGVFTEGVRNGKGTLYLTNGEKVEGSW